MENIMNFEIAPKSTEIQTNWDDARLYCFALNIDGNTGWRLPTKDELDEICQSENDFELDWYWSSTEFNGKAAWGRSMYDGGQDYGRGIDGKNSVNHVRAIRDLKDN
jgi:hypothetical protein